MLFVSSCMPDSAGTSMLHVMAWGLGFRFRCSDTASSPNAGARLLRELGALQQGARHQKGSQTKCSRAGSSGKLSKEAFFCVAGVGGVLRSGERKRGEACACLRAQVR